jgi:hypothetical protein
MYDSWAGNIFLPLFEMDCWIVKIIYTYYCVLLYHCQHVYYLLTVKLLLLLLYHSECSMHTLDLPSRGTGHWSAIFSTSNVSISSWTIRQKRELVFNVWKRYKIPWIQVYKIFNIFVLTNFVLKQIISNEWYHSNPWFITGLLNFFLLGFTSYKHCKGYGAKFKLYW